MIFMQALTVLLVEGQFLSLFLILSFIGDLRWGLTSLYFHKLRMDLKLLEFCIKGWIWWRIFDTNWDAPSNSLWPLTAPSATPDA